MTVKWKFNNPSDYDALEREPGVVADLTARGRAIAEAAGSDARMESAVYRGGAHVVVSSKDHEALLRALDAGR